MVDVVKGKSQEAVQTVHAQEQLSNGKTAPKDDQLLRLVQQLEASVATASASSSSPISGKSAFQIEPGASGILMKSFSEILALIQQILSLEAAQKGSAAEVQGTTAKAAASSIRSSGEYQMGQALIQGGAAIAGAGVSVGMGTLMGKKETNIAMKENEMLSGKLAQVKDIAQYKPTAALAGATTDSVPAGAIGARVERIRQGDIADALSPENVQETKEALKSMNSPEDIDKRVQLQKHASRESNELTRRKSEITQNIANKAGQRNAAVTSAQTIGSSIGSVGSGTLSVGKADKDAAAELNRAATSQSGAVQQGMEAEIQKAIQQIQTIQQAQERAAQSESVR